MTAEAEPARSASRTALGVAAHRAAHRLIDGEPKILDDPIAERLLGDGWLEAFSARSDGGRDAEALALRSRLLVRSRFSEERLEAAVRRGVGQCVVLGAGYDSFAYRQPAWAAGLRIFEVDQPATQADKRRRLAAAGIPIPGNLEFVAIDFERMSLAEGLAASTLDFTRPAFFSCLGVLVYLTWEASLAIFRLVAGFPAGSELVFSFSTPGSAPRLAARVAAAGEPWLTRMDAESIRKELEAIEFSSVSFLEPAAAEHRYFGAPRSDGLPAPRTGSIGAAIVGAR
jgi:methyltransferase (TIGR00027 family)